MASRKELLGKVYKMIPPMLESFHKGMLGRVGVIGGSEDYTGAPYYSAMASARLGCDMSHVICEPGAAAVIKTYSPVLMVHPYMRSEKNMSKDESIDSVSEQVVKMLDRLHVVVIGPGLGRDPAMQETCARVIKEARAKGIPIVLDADGLYIAQTQGDLLQGYEDCILTPNVVEFGRLAKSKNIDTTKEDPTKLCEKLANAFGGVTIVQKGLKDYISNGKHTIVSDGEGGLKRAGGQGDTLTGSLGTLLAYRKAYHDKIWDHDNSLSKSETLALAAYGGSAITRECSRLAFKERGRSLQAGDLTEHVHGAFMSIVGEPNDATDAKL
ncbi:ATP-dependent (S)-NAD(P)H-hydrate dehydratase [Elsinoe australis]|uniref:ATP-dependent (S)-NAD(P)H-hydrate dehydratase n=1 Tax=Elsinoe australis TaxID=40998 RepID=A0A2P8A5I5_9PEZI|nr:YjeF family domain-containing protein [Elsinoe australis]TKX25554.1 ATP-dependent (S)-NAD(P)H-hydrate dehydratase [Elsinoe australis]